MKRHSFSRAPQTPLLPPQKEKLFFYIPPPILLLVIVERENHRATCLLPPKKIPFQKNLALNPFTSKSSHTFAPGSKILSFPLRETKSDNPHCKKGIEKPGFMPFFYEQPSRAARPWVIGLSVGGKKSKGVTGVRCTQKGGAIHLDITFGDLQACITKRKNNTG